MSVRERYRTYLATIWERPPEPDFVVGTSPLPERPFVIVTAAYPRRRARAASRGIPINPADAFAEDAALNTRLAAAIVAKGFTTNECVGRDAANTHREPSFWVWDATAAQAVNWGREFDQFAIVAGDGHCVRIHVCYPENEPPIAPDVVRLDSPDAVLLGLLERELRSRGWDHTTRYVSSDDSQQPILAVGLGDGGISAARSSAPWRFGVATRWRMTPDLERDRLFYAPGLAAIDGGLSDPLELFALPPSTPRLVDPEFGPELEAWIGRIADGVMRLWSSGGRPMSAAAAGWKTTGYRTPRAAPLPRIVRPGAVRAAGGVLLGLTSAAFALVLCLMWISLLSSPIPDPDMQPLFNGALVAIGFAVLLGAGGAAGLLYFAETSQRGGWRLAAGILGASGLPLMILGELGLLLIDAPPVAHAGVFAAGCAASAIGIAVLAVDVIFRG